MFTSDIDWQALWKSPRGAILDSTNVLDLQGQLEQARQVLQTCSPPEEHTPGHFDDVANLLRPMAWKELLAIEVHGARAQIALGEKAWEDAETAATRMISQIEGVSIHSVTAASCEPRQ